MVGSQMVAVIGGQLWQKLESSSPEPPVSKPARKHRIKHRKPRQRKPQPRTRKGVQPDLRQKVVEQYKAGKSASELAKAYGISVSAVYVWANRAGKPTKHHQVQLKEIHGYRCLNCGRRFKSVLPKLDAYCPQPTCNRMSELEEIPPEEVA